MENDGVIAGVSEGKVIIDCATLSPERMQFESDKIIQKYAITIPFLKRIQHFRFVPKHCVWSDTSLLKL